jgi:hypothetical protein
MKIKFNIHVKNNDWWPAIDENCDQIGNYLEWEADEWESEHGDLLPEQEQVIDSFVARMKPRYFKKDEVIDQEIDIPDPAASAM